jgi:hypothetical protein
MEGLEFIPSESVWANIQKAVADHRRRRGGFFFWRFGLPAVLLAGLMSIAYFAATRRPGAVAAPLAHAAAPSVLTAAPSVPVAALSVPAATVASGHETSRDQAVANPIAHGATGRGIATTDRKGTSDSFGEADESLNLVVSPKDATANALIAPYLYQPGLAGQRNSAAVKALAPTTRKNIITLGRVDKPTRPWEAGFTAGGGVSRLNRLNISTSTQDQSLSANLYSFATANAAPSKSYVSDVRPDASFTAGIYLQKPISRRWSVNVGMNLHYYSTRITIGQQVNTYVPATASLIAPNVSQSAQTSTAFIAGDRQVFTNHYYFLELPVNVQYQLNKSHLLPFFLEGGASLSRLMGSDALFYNAHSGTYYKDPGVLEKTQFSISSALMVGLPFRGIRIMAGPQVQYGVTPLVNNHSQGDQHFLYGGLRIVVIPGRK